MYPIVPPRRLSPGFQESLQLDALAELLPDAEVESICRKLRHHWRNRELPPGVTVRSIIPGTGTN